MRKLLILGAIALAAVTVVLSLTWEHGSTALQPGSDAAFYGTAKAGRTITACEAYQHQPCFYTIAGSDDSYELHIPWQYFGMYLITDGCQSFSERWEEFTPKRVDFCAPDPPWWECNCW